MTVSISTVNDRVYVFMDGTEWGGRGHWLYGVMACLTKHARLKLKAKIKI